MPPPAMKRSSGGSDNNNGGLNSSSQKIVTREARRCSQRCRNWKEKSKVFKQGSVVEASSMSCCSSLIMESPGSIAAVRREQAEFGAKVAVESERNERIATKPRRQFLDQMRTQTWEARPKGCFGTDAYALRASMQLRVPNGSEGKERVKPVMLSVNTPASIVAVPYSTWFTTVITGTSAWGPGDSRFDPVTAGLFRVCQPWIIRS
ncbi:hypothetical protein PIB30_019609 [Stylosanthes scabra]|uniref:Uncharacterized protein n=1 Tax=Stylosanthes scabra TaxID=79078 RepID=A0ABU6Q9T4_9FABA|nr:hypothetical protein [Stylosanthes scabra]